jgi:hypothetical protein
VKTAIYLILILALSLSAFTTVVAPNLLLSASPSQLPKSVDPSAVNWGDPIGGGGGGPGAPRVNATFLGSNLIYS